jgi:hypothetical protein
MLADYEAKGLPVPGNHSPLFAPVAEPAIKAGAEVLTLAVLTVARPMSGPILVQHDTTEFSTGVRRSRKPSTGLRSRYDLLDGPSKRGILHSRPHPQHRIVNEGGPDGKGDRSETVALHEPLGKRGGHRRDCG